MQFQQASKMLSCLKYFTKQTEGGLFNDLTIWWEDNMSSKDINTDVFRYPSDTAKGQSHKAKFCFIFCGFFIG